MTGGVLSFGQLGGLALPFLYSAVLGISGSYQIGFLLCWLPALFVGGMLLNTSLRSPK
jgi:fucose permease